MVNVEQLQIKSYANASEQAARQQMGDLLFQNPIPPDQLLSNLGLFLESKHLARLLFMDFLYRQIIAVQGVVMEFGVRWGQNLALFSALRGIYEPFNRHRKIIGFDTFTGFPSIHEKDGQSNMMVNGQLAVSPHYEDTLQQLLSLHETLNPLNHINKHELCIGDVVEELPQYLARCPETIVAMAYFDLDLYEPTVKCLELLRPRMTKGTILGFDELNDPDSPGETLALMEVFGLNHLKIQRFPFASRVSFVVFE
ncbi:MAG: crotonobetainyl-CoA--carnitine CoA-transferase [Nitrospirota bacterium]